MKMELPIHCKAKLIYYDANSLSAIKDHMKNKVPNFYLVLFPNQQSVTIDSI